MVDGRENLLQKVLESHPSKFAFITENAQQFRFQALLSYVDLDSSGRASLVRHGYRLDHEYFYPASAIKLCAAVATLCKLEHMQKTLGVGVTFTTPLAFYPLKEGEQLAAHDISNIESGKITIAHELRKLFLVSDNVAFNRLFAFAGQRYINEMMWQLGLSTTRLRHRLSLQLSTDQNRFSEPMEAYFPHMSVTFPPKLSSCLLNDTSTLIGLKLGKSHVAADGALVLQPMDFSEKNYVSLVDLQNLLVKIFCKDVELNGEPLNLSYNSQMLLTEAMAEYPSSSWNPSYLKSDFPDDYCKLFLPGLCRVRPKRAVRIFNKLGRAYGFTVENAYILDKEMERGFFLSAVIYTNSNEVLNDDKYEYEDIADRLMADLGEMVACAVWNLPVSLKVPLCLSCIPSSLWEDVVRPEYNSNKLARTLGKETNTCMTDNVSGSAAGKFVLQICSCADCLKHYQCLDHSQQRLQHDFVGSQVQTFQSLENNPVCGSQVTSIFSSSAAEQSESGYTDRTFLKFVFGSASCYNYFIDE